MSRFALRFRNDILLKTMVAACVTGFCAACLARSAADNWVASREILYAVYLTGGRGSWHPIFSLLPMITSLLPLFGYLSDDMATQAAYVFPRATKPGVWLGRQYCMLFLYVCCAVLAFLATVFITLKLFGQPQEPAQNFFAFFWQLFWLTVLFWFVFVLFVNLCALRVPITVALLIGVGLTAALAWVPQKSPLIFAVPMTHYYLDVHASSVWRAGITLENQPYANRFTLAVSAGYEVSLLGLLGFAGQLVVRRTEFALSKKALGKE